MVGLTLTLTLTRKAGRLQRGLGALQLGQPVRRACLLEHAMLSSAVVSSAMVSSAMVSSAMVSLAMVSSAIVSRAMGSSYYDYYGGARLLEHARREGGGRHELPHELIGRAEARLVTGGDRVRVRVRVMVRVRVRARARVRMRVRARVTVSMRQRSPSP